MSIEAAVARVHEITAMQQALIDPASVAPRAPAAGTAATPVGSVTAAGQSFASVLANATASSASMPAATSDIGGGAGPSSSFSGSIVNDPNLGPTTNPVPGATGSRLDQGFDGTAQTFLAPFNGTVVYSQASDPGWNGGGYVAIQAARDPNTVFFAAEGLTPTVQMGQTVSVGQQIATPRPSPYNGIPGNFEIGRANPASPGQPLAQVIANPAQMVLGFYNWITSLGGPTASSTSNAGSS